MSASYRKIDYSIRPAKYAERRFMTDIISALRGFGPVPSMRYIGFGSIWFSDFELFHRYLGIDDMVSIEWAGSSKEKSRFKFNVPYDCVSMKFGKSTHVIPKISFKKRTVTWLDYDGKFEPYMLDDAQLVASRAKSGSMLAISFNSHSALEVDQSESEGISAIDLFKSRYGFPDEMMPEKESDLYSRKFTEIMRGFYESSIVDAFAKRKISTGKEFEYERICTINYSDGAPMVTWIYVLFEKLDRDRFDLCAFFELDAIKKFGNEITIDYPSLTVREVRSIEQNLPNGVTDLASFLPAREVEGFSKFYRYMPNFAAIDR